MRIKEVIIDGFKSYANRTVISGFDKSFNAITGRNGTGKSNILDAICFVLGISKLSQVRVDKLSELVYKNGQAGVTKASVTIVFDNSDTKVSPVGYEHCKEIAVTRQIVVGGRNKHLINGRTVRSNQVHNLFHSVQLDVNNPHFLIMQGRIVKMMNMKPLEVLGLIEEAGGTRMFERKKEASLKIIQKKERKVEEINKIIADEISPTLEKLQKDRAAYREFTENQMRIERAKRQTIAHKVWEMKCVLDSKSSDFDKLKSKLDDIEESESKTVEDQKQIGTELKELQRQKEQQMEGKLKTLQSEENERSKSLVKVNSIWQNKKEGLASERKNHEALKKQASDASASEVKTRTTLKTLVQKCADATKRVESLKEELSGSQKQLQALSAGMSSSDDATEQKSMAQQLLEARGEVKAAAAAVNQLELTRKHHESARKKAASQLRKAEKQHKSLEKQLKRAEGEVKRIEKKIGSLRFSEKEETSIAEQVEAKERALADLDERVEALSAKLSRFVNFTYQSPSSSFDRSRVKGLVGRLIKVKDEAMTTAIEVAAGGRLYQLVVDTEKTGKELLKRGKLKQRVTIIPLNKIRARVAKDEKIRAAKRIAGDDGSVRLALELVGYADEVSTAMKYVFGNTLVCDTMKCARAVTFDKSVRMKSVTKEGDSLDPSGVMSGGSNSSRHILASLRKLDDLMAKRKAIASELKPLRQRLESMRDAGSRFRALEGELELKRHELSLVTKRCESSRYASLQSDLEKLDASIANAKADIVKAHARCEEQRHCAKRLEKEIANFEKSRKDKLKSKEAEIASLKKRLVRCETEAQDADQKRQLCALEAEQLRKDVESFAEQVKAGEDALRVLEEKINVLRENVAAERELYTAAKSALDMQTAAMSKCDQKVRELEKRRSRMESRLASLRAAKKKTQHKIRRFEDDRRVAQETIKTLRTNHKWIEAEEQFFGQAGSDYDFESKNIADISRKLAALEKKQESLSQRINHKVMGMIEKAESDYAELRKKREIIKRDKQKIMRTIDELMERKNRALKETYEKVNRDFGSMFSTFLPGTHAELKPVDGKDIFKGLLPRVAFGGKWKESLMELSGGQRSLLALSLVLAMLLFKPAPMYILDEVDAALDVCHTQNIGKLLRTHFKQSQFVIVSLKEGMFDNANVVFTTKNVDGISSVNRTEVSSRDRAAKKVDSPVENDERSAKRKKRRGTKKSGGSVRKPLSVTN